MSIPRRRAFLTGWSADLRRSVAWQGAVRLMIIVSGSGALVAAGRADGSTPPSPFVVLVLGLAVVTAAVPDSHAGLLVVAAVGYLWVTEVNDRAGIWTLVAAVCFAVFHGATTMAALVQRGAGDRVVASRWMLRVGLVVLGTAAGWGVSAAMVQAHPSTNALFFAVALAVIATGCWLLSWRGTSTSAD